MHSWMQIALFNAASASLLALLVALVAPRIQRPAVVHGLWLLVLLKLISPPVFEIGTLPAWDRVQRGFGVVTGLGGASERSQGQRNAIVPRDPAVQGESVSGPAHPDTGAGEEDGRPAADSTDWASAAATRPPWTLRLLPFVVGAGTLLLLGTSLLRLARFRRRTRRSPEAPPELQARAARLARTFGLRRAPRMRIVAGQIPPSLWPGPGACEILLPGALLQRLTDEECDAILAHELAHVRRRDHWLRPLELLIVALYWWNPVAWWARRNLRIAEEQSCDALVLQHLRSRPRVYAEGLLKTVEFLAHEYRAIPLLAMGATGTARLKERVTMILKKNTPGPIPPALRPVLVGAVLLALLVSPAWVQKAASADGDANPERLHQQKMLAIRQDEIRLQREMQQLEQDRRKVRLQIDEKMLQRQLAEMRQEMATLQQAGEKADVQELQNRIASMEFEAALHRKKMQAEQAHTAKRMQVEFQLQDLTLQMELAELEGDRQKLVELTQQNFELQQALRQIDLEAMQDELQRHRERFEVEKKELENLQQSK